MLPFVSTSLVLVALSLVALIGVRRKMYPLTVFAVCLAVTVFAFSPGSLVEEPNAAIQRASAGGGAGDQCERKWDCDNGCCHGGECLDKSDPLCGGGNPDKPPTISGVVVCDVWGDNGWCVSGAKLKLTASDPQGYAVKITGIAGGVNIDCNGNCTINLPEGSGTAKFNVTALGGSGKSASGSAPWKYDASPPLAEYDIAGSLVGEWYANSPTVSASGSDSVSGIASVTILVDGSAESNPVSLNDGTHVVIVTAKDKAGNLSADQTFSAQVDTAAPEISASVPPATCGSWYVSPVTVNASATDALSGVTSLTATLDGAPVPIPFVVSGDGTHSVTLTSTDAANHVATISKTFQMDATPPAISAAAGGAQGDNGWIVSIADVTLSATDATSGVKSIEYRLDGGAWTNGHVVHLEEDGVHSIETRVTDNACGVSTLTETVKLDRTAPTLSYTNGGAVIGGSADIQGTADDATSGADRVEVSFDNGATWKASATDPAGKWSVPMNTVSLPDGEATVLARAVDKAGNSSLVFPTVVIVANGVPEVKLPPTWPVDQAGALQIIPSRAGLKTVTITIFGRTGEKIVKTYNAESVPDAVFWDGTFPTRRAEAGEYRVTVVACDAFGRCGAAEATITIPLLVWLGPPPQTPQVVVTAEILPAPVVIAPASTPVPAPTLAPEPVVIAAEAKESAAVPRKVGVLLLSGVFLFGLLFQSMSDPRPKANRSLADTLRKNIK